MTEPTDDTPPTEPLPTPPELTPELSALLHGAGLDPEHAPGPDVAHEPETDDAVDINVVVQVVAKRPATSVATDGEAFEFVIVVELDRPPGRVGGVATLIADGHGGFWGELNNWLSVQPVAALAELTEAQRTTVHDEILAACRRYRERQPNEPSHEP